MTKISDDICYVILTEKGKIAKLNQQAVRVAHSSRILEPCQHNGEKSFLKEHSDFPEIAISREISFSFAISQFHKYIIKTQLHQMLLLKESHTIVNYLNMPVPKIQQSAVFLPVLSKLRLIVYKALYKIVYYGRTGCQVFKRGI